MEVTYAALFHAGISILRILAILVQVKRVKGIGYPVTVVDITVF
jgi:hypothetical protein